MGDDPKLKIKNKDAGLVRQIINAELLSHCYLIMSNVEM